MKIAVITIQNSGNYGAMLQTFALQTYLRKLKHEVEIVDYDNRHMSKGLDVVRHGFNLLEAYYCLLDMVNYRDRKRLVQNFRSFAKNYLNLGRLYGREELLAGYASPQDVFISGSDQIWNPAVTKGIVDEVYFCGMYRPGSRVISYASSMGGYDFKDKEKNREIAGYLEKYDSVSVRESGYIPALSRLTGRQIVKVMDPVFLLSGEDWRRELRLKGKERRPYILIYAMAAHEKILDSVQKTYAREIQEKRYDIVMIYEPLRRKKGVTYVADAGPREFVELFCHADRIITNSFHGTAFALIFRKKLCVIDNARNMNRIYDLLNELGEGAGKILCKGDEPLEAADIDYGTVDKRLEEMIHDSREFLKRELV